MMRRLWAVVAPAVLALSATGPVPASAQGRCEARRQSCVSECYARYFTIDPQRTKCLASCMSEEDKCKRENAAQQSSDFSKRIRAGGPGA